MYQVILNMYNSIITKHEIVPAIIIVDLYELNQLTPSRDYPLNSGIKDVGATYDGINSR
ncbi:unnamed protein product, partial [Allacma fusca]